MTQSTTVTVHQKMREMEDKLDEMDAKLDRLIEFCNRAVAAAERVGQHPMLASMFPHK
jgi:hypothetical protein